MLYTPIYYIMYAWAYVHALLPMRLLYVLSDVMYFLVYHVIAYRKRDVRQNLKNSFPEKNAEELKYIERRFYHHFCDYFFETIKLLHITEKEIQRRISFTNIELVKNLMKEGNSCLMYLSHYGNWEWIPSIALQFDKNILLGQIYRPLRNQPADRLFLKIRSRFGSFGIKKNETLREILKLKSENKQVLIGFISDQNPSWRNVSYWTTFLNQETAVFTGVERIAKKTDYAVVYLDVTKLGRGRYSCECKLISDDPQNEPEYAITERYIRATEETILRNPPYWLWSHRRWKMHKEEHIHIK